MTMNGQTPVENLQADLERMTKLVNLYRQQRDQFASLANDLQVELAMLREQPASQAPQVYSPADNAIEAGQ